MVEMVGFRQQIQYRIWYNMMVFIEGNTKLITIILYHIYYSFVTDGTVSDGLNGAFDDTDDTDDDAGLAGTYDRFLLILVLNESVLCILSTEIVFRLHVLSELKLKTLLALSFRSMYLYLYQLNYNYHYNYIHQTQNSYISYTYFAYN
jgi:hypothetical protein